MNPSLFDSPDVPEEDDRPICRGCAERTRVTFNYWGTVVPCCGEKICMDRIAVVLDSI